MWIVVIINPIAGASTQRAEVQVMIARLRAAGMRVDPQVTAGPGDARRGASAAAGGAQPADAVIVVGGDGTVCEVADGLTGTTVPMLIWPTGTENLVAKSLGFRPDAEQTLACLIAGRPLALDVGTMNGRSFLVVVGVGFDAEVVHRLTRLRSGHITHLSYAGPLWRTFWEHRFPGLRVHRDGQPFWEGRGMVFIGNLSRYALGLPVVRDARADDGLLDLCILPCENHFQLIGHSLRTLVARHVEHSSTRYERVRHVRVESVKGDLLKSRVACSDVPVELDGEAAGCLPIEVAIHPGAIQVLVPPKPHSV